jgi:hypothetical protein
MRLNQLKMAMLGIVEDPRASRIEKIEAAKVFAACAGVLLPDTSETMLSTRQAVELRQAKQAIADRMQRRKERKRLENRRGYLKRKLRQVKQDGISIPAQEEKNK